MAVKHAFTSAVSDGGNASLVQPSNWNADHTLSASLAAVDALTPAADRLPYFTSATEGALATFTAFGRSFIDDDNAAAGRSTLELGSISTQAADNVSITGGALSGLTSITLTDASEIKWGDGSCKISGSGATDVITITGVASVRSGGSGLVVGADASNTSLTDSTSKYGRIATPHYLREEKSASIAFMNCGSSTNTLNIGGGTASYNAATDILFYTAANYNTVTGTARLKILSAGRTLMGVTLLSDNGADAFQLNGGMYLTGAISALNVSAPSAGTNMYKQYAADQTAGNSCPHFITEAGHIVKLYSQAHQAAVKADYTSGDLDTEAEVITAVNALATSINNLQVLLETNGLMLSA